MVNIPYYYRYIGIVSVGVISTNRGRDKAVVGHHPRIPHSREGRYNVPPFDEYLHNSLHGFLGEEGLPLRVLSGTRSSSIPGRQGISEYTSNINNAYFDSLLFLKRKLTAMSENIYRIRTRSISCRQHAHGMCVLRVDALHT